MRALLAMAVLALAAGNACPVAADIQTAADTAGPPPEKRVLILNSYHKGYGWSDREAEGIEEALRLSPQTELHIEYMDAKRLADAKHLANLYEMYRHKFAKVRFDVVLTCDNDAFDFLRQYRRDLFPGVPAVFCGINDFDPAKLVGQELMTGVVEDSDYRATIELALRLRPAARRVVVVSDLTVTGLAHERPVRRLEPEFSGRARFEFLSLGDMTLADLLSRLRGLREDSVVLVLSHSVDRTGRALAQEETARQLNYASGAPTFAVVDWRVGYGAVGGRVVTAYYQGKMGGEIALRILRGQSAADIPVVMQSPNKYMFDYQALQRWGIDESLLPAGSIILNRPPSLYEEHRSLILTGGMIVAVLTAVIVLLLVILLIRRRAEAALAAQEHRYRTIVENINDSLFIHDFQGRILDVNGSACRLLERTRDQLLGANLSILGSEETAQLMPQRMQELKARGAVVFDAERVRPDGSRLFMSVGAKVVSGEGRGVIQSIVRDLTERRHIEERLRQAQKMEAVGRLAGGIAHDFRNQLTVIHGYAELLRDRPGISEDEAENVREILKASARSSEMTGQLLAFSRNDLLQFKVTDLGALVADIGKSLPRLVGEDVRVSVATGDETCCANLDPNQFQQAIFNLAVNARHAMPGGGQLSIEVARVDLDEEFAQRHPDTRPGPYVRVLVADTGCGMDAATLERAFEPFFTTKEVGAGTGLGLSMVYGFVKQSGGSVEVSSEPGKGSTFRLYFPRLEACTEGARAQAPKAESPKGRETILVVEDEDLVRRLLVTFLREAGYTALDVADPGSAAPLVKAYHGPIHLMVTDVVMPEINGVELARRIRELRPGIPLLFITGYASRDLSPCGLDEMDGELLAKPFGRDELLQKIRQVLDAQTGAE